MQKTYPALRKIDSKVGTARSNPLLISMYTGTTWTLGTFPAPEFRCRVQPLGWVPRAVHFIR